MASLKNQFQSALNSLCCGWNSDVRIISMVSSSARGNLYSKELLSWHLNPKVSLIFLTHVVLKEREREGKIKDFSSLKAYHSISIDFSQHKALHLRGRWHQAQGPHVNFKINAIFTYTQWIRKMRNKNTTKSKKKKTQPTVAELLHLMHQSLLSHRKIKIYS